MNNNINVITHKEELYYKCENMEELYDKFYYPLLVEYKELKKQLEKKQNIACDWKDGCLENASKIEILETQQKEFIKYLEKEIKRINPNDLDISELNLRLDGIKFTQYLIYKEILQKYEEIIGDDK